MAEPGDTHPWHPAVLNWQSAAQDSVPPKGNPRVFFYPFLTLKFYSIFCKYHFVNQIVDIILLYYIIIKKGLLHV